MFLFLRACKTWHLSGRFFQLSHAPLVLPLVQFAVGVSQEYLSAGRLPLTFRLLTGSGRRDHRVSICSSSVIVFHCIVQTLQKMSVLTLRVQLSVVLWNVQKGTTISRTSKR